jgi:hypothetical protein
LRKKGRERERLPYTFVDREERERREREKREREER